MRLALLAALALPLAWAADAPAPVVRAQPEIDWKKRWSSELFQPARVSSRKLPNRNSFGASYIRFSSCNAGQRDVIVRNAGQKNQEQTGSLGPTAKPGLGKRRENQCRHVLPIPSGRKPADFVTEWFSKDQAKVSVYASSGVTDGRGGYGYVIYVRGQDYDAALQALGVR